MKHCNRSPFEGVLSFVDRPSDNSPSGARGHNVVLLRAAAELALPTLLGMGVGYTPAWDGHDAQRKIGIITSAEIVGDEIRVGGYLFGRDFPLVIEALSRAGDTRAVYGMSYELADARVDDMRKKIWQISRLTFTGAAILLQSRAAYKQTSFWLADSPIGLALAANGRDEKDSEEGREGFTENVRDVVFKCV